VSSSQQGRSGLGIEAQREALRHFAKAEGFEVAREFVEVETGKGTDALDRRPQLKAAFAVARKQRANVAAVRTSVLSDGWSAIPINCRWRNCVDKADGFRGGLNPSFGQRTNRQSVRVEKITVTQMADGARREAK
jgi:hypothetical protein